jgi:hypothetical protein
LHEVILRCRREDAALAQLRQLAGSRSIFDAGAILQHLAPSLATLRHVTRFLPGGKFPIKPTAPGRLSHAPHSSKGVPHKCALLLRRHVPSYATKTANWCGLCTAVLCFSTPAKNLSMVPPAADSCHKASFCHCRRHLVSAPRAQGALSSRIVVAKGMAVQGRQRLRQHLPP